MTIYYVDGAVGNDGNAGTSEGSGNAWATIQHAVTTMVGGDTAYVKNSVVYAENVLVGKSGAAGTPITLIGYADTVHDLGRVIIRPASGTRVVYHSSGYNYWQWANFTFDATNVTAEAYYSNNGDYVNLFNCRITGSGASYACRVDLNCSWTYCQFDNNSVHGLYAFSGPHIVGCVFKNNGGSLITTTNTAMTVIYRTVIELPGTGGVSGNGYIACTLVQPTGETADNVYGTINNSLNRALLDCVLHGGDYGINYQAIDNGPYHSRTVGCLFSDNRISGIDQAAKPGWEELLRATHTSGSADFTDIDGEDLTIPNASDAVDAGITPGLLS